MEPLIMRLQAEAIGASLRPPLKIHHECLTFPTYILITRVHSSLSTFTIIIQFLGVAISSWTLTIIMEPSPPYPLLLSSSHAHSLFLPKWSRKNASMFMFLYFSRPLSRLPFEQRVKNITLNCTYRSLCARTDLCPKILLDAWRLHIWGYNQTLGLVNQH